MINTMLGRAATGAVCARQGAAPAAAKLNSKAKEMERLVSKFKIS